MYIDSYFKVKILDANNVFNDTLYMYRKIVKYYVKVILKEWDNLQEKNGRDSKLEKLTVKTDKNPIAKYDVKTDVGDIPSYLRRSAMRQAFGIVSPYKKNYQKYLEGKVGKPKLLPFQNSWPSLYINQRASCLRFISKDEIKIKILKKNNWIWYRFKLRHQDVKYLESIKEKFVLDSPSLQKKGKSCYLVFRYSDNIIDFKNTGLYVGVDLGFNPSACCSLINKDGKRLGSNFIFERDLLSELNYFIKKRKNQQKAGSRRPLKAWGSYATTNNKLAYVIAKRITKYAVESNAECIIFEHLDPGAFPGADQYKELVQKWNYGRIFNLTSKFAHLEGIRVRKVFAGGTSLLAYDGSGYLNRDHIHYELATFSNGKQYNSNLSSANNIAARHVIREIMKTLTDEQKTILINHIPSLRSPYFKTLNSLVVLSNVIKSKRYF